MWKQQQQNDYEPSPQKKLRIQQQDQLDQDQINQALEEAEGYDNPFNDVSAFYQLLQVIEMHIQINQDLRTKYADRPERFVDSEIDLDEDIRILSSLSAYPELFVCFAKSPTLPKLIQLLQHDNNDIVTELISFFQDLVSTAVDPEYDDSLLMLYDSLVSNFIFEAVVDCIIRLRETVQEESEAVHKCLGIIENMIEIKSSYCKIICEKTKQIIVKITKKRILQWLGKRVSIKNLTEKTIDDVKLYASEVLVQLLQGDTSNTVLFGKHGGIDDLLIALQTYRTSNELAVEDVETAENIFNALQLNMLNEENRETFFECEGIQLMIKLIQAKGKFAVSSLKSLALSINRLSRSCDLFVESGGLSLLFPILINKGIKSANPVIQKDIDGKLLRDKFFFLESVLTIIRYLLKLCGERKFERVMAKLESLEYIDRIITLRNNYYKNITLPKNYNEVQYLKNLDKGLSIVENSDIIILELINKGSPQLQAQILTLLDKHKLNVVNLLIIVGFMIDFTNDKKDLKYYEELAEEIMNKINPKKEETQV